MAFFCISSDGVVAQYWYTLAGGIGHGYAATRWFDFWELQLLHRCEVCTHVRYITISCNTILTSIVTLAMLIQTRE
jgi:hypothetical protein